MKTMILLITVSILGFSPLVRSQEVTKPVTGKDANVTRPNGPVANFDKTVCDLGDLTQGVPGTSNFTLSNTGNEPLIISSAKASCGCTNLTFSQEPILPGKSSTISATYNAAAPGGFTKTITVVTNASSQPLILQIKGKVVPKV
jgi:hypothetical protein